MLGLYLAYTFATRLGGVLGFWGGIVAAGLVVAALGALIEIVLLRRIYQAPELFQLLATFALVLVINDAVQYLWGPEDLLGPRRRDCAARSRFSAATIQATTFPDRRRPCRPFAAPPDAGQDSLRPLIRAATQDREMVGALGVNQALLFTSCSCWAPSSPASAARSRWRANRPTFRST